MIQPRRAGSRSPGAIPPGARGLAAPGPGAAATCRVPGVERRGRRGARGGDDPPGPRPRAEGPAAQGVPAGPAVHPRRLARRAGRAAGQAHRRRGDGQGQSAPARSGALRVRGATGLRAEPDGVGWGEPRAGPFATGHVDAARHVADGSAGVAATMEAAALAYGLDFPALEVHRAELRVAREWVLLPGARALLDLIASRVLLSLLEALGGYDLRRAGEVA